MQILDSLSQRKIVAFQSN